MTVPTGQTGRMVRLPAWAIGVLLIAGLVSVPFAPGSFFTFLAVGLLAVNVVGVFKYFGEEVKRLKAAHGSGPIDKAALRKDAMQSQATPMWLVITLAFGSMWIVVAVIKLVGLLLGLLLILALFALIGVAARVAYETAKRKGYFNK